MGYSPENDDDKINPEAHAEQLEARRIEESNKQTREKFESLKSMLGSGSQNARYSKKDADDIIKKMEETNK